MVFTVALVGECMIELQEIEPGRVSQTFGGDTLNTAIYMARLVPFFPATVDYVTALGTDSFSDRMVAFWEREGVGSELVQREAGRMPGLYYIELDESGERHFSYWRGEAAARQCFEYPGSDSVLGRLGEYSALYLSGISIAILTPRSRDRLFARLVQLAAAGTRIYLDYNYRAHLWESLVSARTVYERLLPSCHTVFVGRDELATIHDLSSSEAGHRYLAGMGVSESVIRNGSAPCSIMAGDECIDVAAAHVDRVIDTTAAGDSFSAAYLLARNGNCDPRRAAMLAHRMAAYVICHRGAIAPLDAMPDFSDLAGQNTTMR